MCQGLDFSWYKTYINTKSSVCHTAGWKRKGDWCDECIGLIKEKALSYIFSFIQERISLLFLRPWSWATGFLDQSRVENYQVITGLSGLSSPQHTFLYQAPKAHSSLHISQLKWLIFLFEMIIVLQLDFGWHCLCFSPCWLQGSLMPALILFLSLRDCLLWYGMMSLFSSLCR